MIFLFRRKDNQSQSPYVNEEVVNVPKEEMVRRIAEVVKKASEDEN